MMLQSLKLTFLGLFALLSILFIFSPAFPESGSDAEAPAPVSFDDFKDRIDGGVAPAGKTGTEGSAYLPKIWCGNIDDPPTRQTCWEAFRAGLDYYTKGLPHRQKVIAWQHFSTRIIFFVVLLLVGAGIYFAWVQFKKEVVSKQVKQEPAGAPGTQSHTLEISTTGVKVSSPVLGVIILTLSLAFFYLYLRYVYPVTEIF